MYNGRRDGLTEKGLSVVTQEFAAFFASIPAAEAASLFVEFVGSAFALPAANISSRVERSCYTHESCPIMACRERGTLFLILPATL